MYNLSVLAPTGEAQLLEQSHKQKTPFIREVGTGKKESRQKMKDNY